VTFKVSVLMPVYNAEAFLQEAIDSILHQTFTDFEFIIINDGSIDSSEMIICSYDDPRIKYIKNEKNIGLVESLNKGIALARGEYIARMDADDISLPKRLQKQVKFMDEHPEVGVCGTAYRYFGERDLITYPPQEYSKAYTRLAWGPSLGHPTCIIRKATLDQYHLRYETEYECAEDYALWIKLSQYRYITSLPEILLLYRWHSVNKSQTDSNRIKARTAARKLWFERQLSYPMTQNGIDYLRGDDTNWEAFREGRKLIEDVLSLNNASNLDKKYFGRNMISDWQHRLILAYPLRGFLLCARSLKTRKWSGASFAGLSYWFIKSLFKKFNNFKKSVDLKKKGILC
jgi:glycosyltransferase involved in cell wall biosynthesis